MNPSNPAAIFSMLALLLIIGSLSLSPIPQPESYHQFADQYSFWGIPNTLNVISNFSFFAVGLYGLLCRPRFSLGRYILLGLITFLIGLILVSFGSAYYHWSPSSKTLLWDRLPMSITFMGISFGLIIAQTKTRSPILLYFVLHLVAVGTTFYWYLFNDLRFYIMCQLFPLLLLLFSAVRLRSYPLSKNLGYCALAYIAAKVCEYYDTEIFELSAQWISGHTMKHITAAIGGFFILRFFLFIKPLELKAISEHGGE